MEDRAAFLSLAFHACAKRSTDIADWLYKRAYTYHQLALLTQLIVIDMNVSEKLI